MVASYGDTSGFMPVAGDEVQEVNGGAASATVILAGAGAVSPLGLVVTGVAVAGLVYLAAKGK